MVNKIKSSRDSLHISVPELSAQVLVAIKQGTPLPDLEHVIARHPLLALTYAKVFIPHRWAEAEPYIIQSLIKHTNDYNQLVQLTMDYAQKHIVGRWVQLEPCILRKPKAIYLYSLHHVGGRWKEGENCLVNNPYWAYTYAHNIIKGRWRRAEPYILKDPEMAYNYSLNIIKRRWLAAERVLVANVSIWSVKYAERLLNRRWPEIEEQIFLYPQNTHTWQAYASFLLRLAVKDRNPQILVEIANKGYAKRLQSIIKYWRSLSKVAARLADIDSNYPYILRKKHGADEYYVPPADFPYW
jgi:hypothetical protein